MGEVPPLNQFLFDRVWLKAYPAFFVDLRINPESRRRFYEYRDSGAFEAWTEYAFRLYRTLNCVKIALRRGYDVADLRPRQCSEVLRYGESGNVWDFEVDMDSREVVVDINGDKYRWGLDVVQGVQLVQYAVVVRGRLKYDKMIYVPYKPWLKVGVRPYYADFTPHLIRLFYNPTLRVKEELGIKAGDEWFAWHENWIPLEAITEDVIRRNHELAFDLWLRDFAVEEWRKWFLELVDLVVRVSHVEINRDVTVPKEHLIWAMHGVGGVSKTLKSGGVTKVSYLPTDAGIKYYVTVDRLRQVKVYTKAVNLKSGVVLNRLEFTVGLRGMEANLGFVKPMDVFKRVYEPYMEVVKMLSNVNGIASEVKETLRPFVRCRRNCELHYSFLVDVILAGCIKGSKAFRHVVEVYKASGLVKVKGRGRNARVCLNDSYLMFTQLRERILSILGIAIEELKLSRIEVREEPELEEPIVEEEETETSDLDPADTPHHTQ